MTVSVILYSERAQCFGNWVDKAQKLSNSECNIPLSGPFGIFLIYHLLSACKKKYADMYEVKSKISYVDEVVFHYRDGKSPNVTKGFVLMDKIFSI